MLVQGLRIRVPPGSWAHLEREPDDGGRTGSCTAALALHRSSDGAKGQHDAAVRVQVVLCGFNEGEAYGVGQARGRRERMAVVMQHTRYAGGGEAIGVWLPCFTAQIKTDRIPSLAHSGQPAATAATRAG